MADDVDAELAFFQSVRRRTDWVLSEIEKRYAEKYAARATTALADTADDIRRHVDARFAEVVERIRAGVAATSEAPDEDTRGAEPEVMVLMGGYTGMSAINERALYVRSESFDSLVETTGQDGYLPTIYEVAVLRKAVPGLIES